MLLGRVYTLRRVDVPSGRVVTPVRSPDERVPTTRLVVPEERTELEERTAPEEPRVTADPLLRTVEEFL